MNIRLDTDERQEISELVEIALTALSLVFLVLLLVEFAVDLSPAQSRWVEFAGWLIWAAFTLDFVVRLALAGSKTRYLRANWLAALSVALPAFRVFRAARAVRAVRSLRLVRLVTGTNRGARALRRVVGFAGAGYVAVLSVVVVLLAAAGISWLEHGHSDATITSFGEGLWWASTTIIQQGSERHPVTVEGRILAALLMIFALAVSGYITAALAVFLLGWGKSERENDTASLRDEITALREELRRAAILSPAPPAPALDTESDADGSAR